MWEGEGEGERVDDRLCGLAGGAGSEAGRIVTNPGSRTAQDCELSPPVHRQILCARPTWLAYSHPNKTLTGRKISTPPNHILFTPHLHAIIISCQTRH